MLPGQVTKELGRLGIPGDLAVSLWGTLPLRQLGTLLELRLAQGPAWRPLVPAPNIGLPDLPALLRPSNWTLG